MAWGRSVSSMSSIYVPNFKQPNWTENVNPKTKFMRFRLNWNYKKYRCSVWVWIRFTNWTWINQMRMTPSPDLKSWTTQLCRGGKRKKKTAAKYIVRRTNWYDHNERRMIQQSTNSYDIERWSIILRKNNLISIFAHITFAYTQSTWTADRLKNRLKSFLHHKE